jgi:hypothetical protein
MSLSVNNLSRSAIHTLPAPASQPGLLGLSKRFVEKIGDSSCYQDIVARYPGMDSASQTMVKILCENELKTLDPDRVPLSNQGIHGIRDALQQNTNLQSLTMDVSCLNSNENCLTTFALDMVYK